MGVHTGAHPAGCRSDQINKCFVFLGKLILLFHLAHSFEDGFFEVECIVLMS